MEILTEEQIERLGELADKADNILAFTIIPIGVDTKLDACKGALEDISKEIKSLYEEMSGNNPWKD